MSLKIVSLPKVKDKPANHQIDWVFWAKVIFVILIVLGLAFLGPLILGFTGTRTAPNQPHTRRAADFPAGGFVRASGIGDVQSVKIIDSSQGPFLYGTFTASGATKTSGFAALYHTNGTLNWAQEMNADQDAAFDCGVETSDGFYLAGTNSASGDDDIFQMKLHRNGSLSFAHNIGDYGIQESVVTCLSLPNSNEVLVGGKRSTGNWPYRGLLMKVDADDGSISQYNVVDSNSDQGYKVTALAQRNNTVSVSGYFFESRYSITEQVFVFDTSPDLSSNFQGIRFVTNFPARATLNRLVKTDCGVMAAGSINYGAYGTIFTNYAFAANQPMFSTPMDEFLTIGTNPQGGFSALGQRNGNSYLFSGSNCSWPNRFSQITPASGLSIQDIAVLSSDSVLYAGTRNGGFAWGKASIGASSNACSNTAVLSMPNGTVSPFYSDGLTRISYSPMPTQSTVFPSLRSPSWQSVLGCTDVTPSGFGSSSDHLGQILAGVLVPIFVLSAAGAGFWWHRKRNQQAAQLPVVNPGAGQLPVVPAVLPRAILAPPPPSNRRPAPTPSRSIDDDNLMELPQLDTRSLGGHSRGRPVQLNTFGRPRGRQAADQRSMTSEFSEGRNS